MSVGCQSPGGLASPSLVDVPVDHMPVDHVPVDQRVAESPLLDLYQENLELFVVLRKEAVRPPCGHAKRASRSQYNVHENRSSWSK